MRAGHLEVKLPGSHVRWDEVGSFVADLPQDRREFDVVARHRLES
jgi:hypothetical protein